MIDLEIQALALTREGLSLEVGRLAGSEGFVLLRQRLVNDPHGVLLAMVVRGSRFKKRALEAALAGCERFVSVELLPAGEDFQPHFAVTRATASGYVPPPAPVPEPLPEPVPAPPARAATVPVAPAPSLPPPLPEADEREAWEALVVRKAAPSPVPSTVEVMAWDDTPSLAADAVAVEQALADLARLYPGILPRVQALDRDVAPGARVASLRLAGQRIGAWLAREKPPKVAPSTPQSLAQTVLPALSALVETTLPADGQLHILHSPLCQANGHSGCEFYAGLLEGLLGDTGAVVPVCCRSFGAEECILAVGD